MQVTYELKLPNNQLLTIRPPKTSDAQRMCDYINALSKEQTFIRFQGEQVTTEYETEYLQKQLKKIEEKKAVMLLATVDEKIVGICGIDLKDKIEKHIGSLGISVALEYRGKGIGKQLLGQAIDLAKNHLDCVRILELSVFATNCLAIKLYEKFGFKEYGRLPEGVARQDKYEDHVFMYLKLK